MTQLSFGPGVMWGERVDAVGSGIGPRQFGLMQDVDITFSYTAKELYGQEQFPAAIARGQGKVTGKAKLAQINTLLYSDIFWGITSATGQLAVSQYESATIPASPSYTVTVANASTYNDDLGISYAASGRRFNRVTSPANAGEYTVNLSTGVYTFSASDAGLAVKVSYRYTIPSTGRSITITNQAQGFTPAWKGTFYQRISPTVPGAAGITLPMTLTLNACVSSSLSFPFTQDNWTLNAFDFMAFADASGTIGTFSAVEQ